jgi:hypothetical protein
MREDSPAQRRRTLLRDSNPVALCALPEQEQVDQHRQKSPRFAIAIRLAVLAAQNHAQRQSIIPNKMAASTSVRKCAPNAMRLNPTKTTSDIALKIDRKRQCRVLRTGRTKAEVARKAKWLRWCGHWQNCNRTNPQTDRQRRAAADEQGP